MIALFVFPLSVAILTPLCCLVPYLFAISYNHVHPVLPYISDTGGILPESSLFSQLLDINAIMISFTAFIRYKQIKVEIQSQSQRQNSGTNGKQRKRIEFINKCCLYLAYLTTFGTVIIGNYRMTEILVGHAMGVLFAFGSAILYLLLMGYLTLKLSKNKFTENLGKFRLIIALSTVMSCGLMVFFGYLSILAATFNKVMDNEFRFKWSVEDPGYVWHCLSALCEWFAVLTLTPYFGSFVPEFKDIYWKSLRQSCGSNGSNGSNGCNGVKANDGINTDSNANQVV